MSAVTGRHPFNSFYAESEATDRTSFVEHMASGGAAGKTRELARAVGRQLAGPAPSFRPPLGWLVDTRNADVVWHGDGSRADSVHEDQFSDAESWDAGHLAPKSAHTPIIDDDSRSTFGHIRTSSVGSSIFAGRGAQRRKEAPPPLLLVPAEHLITIGKSAGSPMFALVSPATENSMYESAPDHGDFNDHHQEEGRASAAASSADRNMPFDEWQMPRSGTMRSTSPVGKEHTLASRTSSRSTATMQRSSSGRDKGEDSSDQMRASQSFIDTTNSSPTSKSSRSDKSARAEPSHDGDEAIRRRLPDDTLVPKMPAIPSKDDLLRQRSTSSKQRNRRDRSPMVMPEDEAENEERKLMEEIDDAKRMSTLGPRLKKNSPAPWELSGYDDEESSPSSPLPRPSLRETLRASSDAADRPFARFRGRPSVESPAAPSSGARHTAASASAASGTQPTSGLGRSGWAASLKEEAAYGDERAAAEEGTSSQSSQSLFSSQRSRSKSVSSNAVSSVAKGPGLALSAGSSSSKKSKLVKAFRLGRDDRSGSSDAVSADHLPPFDATATFAPPRGQQGQGHGPGHPQQPIVPGRSIGYKKNSQDSASSAPSPTFRTSSFTTGQTPTGTTTKSASPDLAQLMQNSNGKYHHQAYSPGSSPNLGGRTPLSPRAVGGGGLALPHNRPPTNPASELRASASKDGQLTVSQMPLSASSTSLSADAAESSEHVPPQGGRAGSGESSCPSTLSETGTLIGKTSGVAMAPHNSKFPGLPDGVLPTSGSGLAGAGGGGLPMPGFHAGVQYKLISLEQAREQMRNSHDRLAPSPSGRDHASSATPNLSAGSSSPMRHSPSMHSFQSNGNAEEPRSRQPSEGGMSQRAVKNKKSGLFRMRKKDKGSSVYDVDGSDFPANVGARDPGTSGQVVGLMPSFSVTGSDFDSGDRKAEPIETPALSLRPVSSMFSGLGANFLDSSMSDVSEGAGASAGGTASSAAAAAALTAGGGGGSGDLLAPYSPALTSYSHESSNRSSTGTNFEDAQERLLRTPGHTASPAGSARGPSVTHISPTPHAAAVPGPVVPGSAGSQTSAKTSIYSGGGGERMPSLEAEGSTGSGHSRFHSPATSPTSPSFNMTVHVIHGKRGGALDDAAQLRARARMDATTPNIQSITDARPDTWIGGDATASGLVVPGTASIGSPKLGGSIVPEEVRRRAIEIEEQMKLLSDELHQLRDVHLSTVNPAAWASAVAAVASDAETDVCSSGPSTMSMPIKNCPCCGCGCAEQRRLQSLNEVAVLKGLGVLDRGRALKPSSNMGNTGKFGGYTNR